MRLCTYIIEIHNSESPGQEEASMYSTRYKNMQPLSESAN